VLSWFPQDDLAKKEKLFRINHGMEVRRPFLTAMVKQAV